MKEKIFVKKNVFTCVMFGAIFLFVLFESFTQNSDLSILAFFIAIPTFLLSLIKLVVNILEDINDKITAFLVSIENRNDPILNWEILQRVRQNCEDKNVSSVIEKHC